MPLIFRHLAAAVLPLSATAAGILAVGTAVQLPRGPAPVISAPSVISPLEPAPGVVARLPPVVRVPARPVEQASAAPRILGCNRERPVVVRGTYRACELPTAATDDGDQSEPVSSELDREATTVRRCSPDTDAGCRLAADSHPGRRAAFHARRLGYTG